MTASLPNHQLLPKGRYRTRLLATVWLLVMGLCILLLTEQLRRPTPFDSGLLSLLPSSEQAPEVEFANQKLTQHFANQLLFLIAPSTPESSQIHQASEQFAEQLQQSGLFTTIRTRPDSTLLHEQTRTYFAARYHLLDDATRQQLLNQQHTSISTEAKRQLFSPLAAPRQASLQDDPFSTFQHWLERESQSNRISADSHGFIIQQQETTYRLVFASFSGSAYDLQLQQQLMNTINTAEAELNQQDLQLLRSGLLFHTAAGARQARSEMSTIGVGSLIGITLLLLWQFRSPTPLLLSLLAIGSGCLVALSLCLLVFERVHMITLAFGATLVGVSIDYALHYLCCQRDQDQSQKLNNLQQKNRSTLRHILPAISLGLISSVLAYTAQALTPFPGLQQMALFSACGLIAAWLTVICVFPLFDKTKGSTSALGLRLRQWQQHKPRARGLGAAVTLFAALGLSQLQFNDDIALLQTSPPSLLQQETAVQQLLARAGSGRFLLISADNSEALLQREEQLRQTLDSLVAHDQLQSYQALSQHIPSLARQADNYQLQQSLYQPNATLDAFFTDLGASQQLINSTRQAFIDGQQQQLHFADWIESASAHPYRHLWLGNEQPQASSIITLGSVATPQVYQQLASLTQSIDGVHFVNRVDDLTQLLSRYRVTITQWVGLAYGLIFLLLLLRYRRQAWPIIVAPLLATATTFTLLSLAGQPLNLFNLLAALLILGIGLDMGIFLRESQHQAHAWAAITLSAITTLLAFGLLALSQTPVLHHFGITVLLGIGLSWLLAMHFAPGSDQAGIHQKRK